MNVKSFDIIIIGSGSAGVSAAEAARDSGAYSIALVDAAERLGGECPNRGCVPTKSLLRSVEVLSLARRAGEFGLKIPEAGFDLDAMMARKRGIIDRLTGDGRVERVLSDLGVTLIRGRARFTGPDEIDVDGKPYRAGKFIVATGSEVFVPPIEGLDGSGYLTSDRLVDLGKIPESIVIIGGGPIGVEWAQVLAPLGTKVTVIDAASQLLPREDVDIAAVVLESFRRQGIDVRTGSRTVAVAKDNGRFVVKTSPVDGKGETAVESAALMIATGKRPAIGGLDLANARIEIDGRGIPVLNEYLQSSNNAVYFAGDAAGQLMFTHVAHAQGVIAATNALEGNVRKIDLSVTPRGTFCAPEVGSVGLTEKEARAKGFEVGVGKAAYSYFGKALVSGDSEGLVKIVADKKSGLVLGGHVVGQAAAELVHEIALAMYAKIPYAKIAEMIHVYPTYSEAIGGAASVVQ